MLNLCLSRLRIVAMFVFIFGSHAAFAWDYVNVGGTATSSCDSSGQDVNKVQVTFVSSSIAGACCKFKCTDYTKLKIHCYNMACDNPATGEVTEDEWDFYKHCKPSSGDTSDVDVSLVDSADGNSTDLNISCANP